MTHSFKTLIARNKDSIDIKKQIKEKIKRSVEEVNEKSFDSPISTTCLCLDNLYIAFKSSEPKTKPEILIYNLLEYHEQRVCLPDNLNIKQIDFLEASSEKILFIVNKSDEVSPKACLYHIGSGKAIGFKVEKDVSKVIFDNISKKVYYNDGNELKVIHLTIEDSKSASGLIFDIKVDSLLIHKHVRIENFEMHKSGEEFLILSNEGSFQIFTNSSSEPKNVLSDGKKIKKYQIFRKKKGMLVETDEGQIIRLNFKAELPLIYSDMADHKQTVFNKKENPQLNKNRLNKTPEKIKNLRSKENNDLNETSGKIQDYQNTTSFSFVFDSQRKGESRLIDPSSDWTFCENEELYIWVSVIEPNLNFQKKNFPKWTLGRNYEKITNIHVNQKTNQLAFVSSNDKQSKIVWLKFSIGHYHKLGVSKAMTTFAISEKEGALYTSNKNQITKWNIKTKEIIHTFDVSEHRITCIRTDSLNHNLFYGTVNGRIYSWQKKNKKLVFYDLPVNKDPEIPNLEVYFELHNSKNQIYAYVKNSSEFFILKFTENFEKINENQLEGDPKICNMKLLCKHNLVVIGSQSNQIIVYNEDNFQTYYYAKHREQPSCFYIDSHEQFFISTSSSELVVWNVPSFSVHNVIRLYEVITHMELLDNGVFLTLNNNEQITFWNFNDMSKVYVFEYENSSEGIQNIVYSKFLKSLFIHHKNDLISIVNPSNSLTIADPKPVSYSGHVNQIVYSNKHKLLLILKDNMIQALTRKNGTEGNEKEFQIENFSYSDLIVADDLDLILLVSYQNDIDCLEIKEDKKGNNDNKKGTQDDKKGTQDDKKETQDDKIEAQNIKIETQRYKIVTQQNTTDVITKTLKPRVSPNLFTFHESYTITIWPLENRKLNKPIRSFEFPNKSSIYQVCEGPESSEMNIIYTGDRSGQIYKFTYNLAGQIGEWKNIGSHLSEIISIKFWQNKKRLVSLSSDKTLKVWDVLENSEKLLYSLPDQENIKQMEMLSSHGLLCTYGYDNSINFWDLNSMHKFRVNVPPEIYRVECIVVNKDYDANRILIVYEKQIPEKTIISWDVRELWNFCFTDKLFLKSLMSKKLPTQQFISTFKNWKNIYQNSSLLKKYYNIYLIASICRQEQAFKTLLKDEKIPFEFFAQQIDCMQYTLKRNKTAQFKQLLHFISKYDAYFDIDNNSFKKILKECNGFGHTFLAKACRKIYKFEDDQLNIPLEGFYKDDITIIKEPLNMYIKTTHSNIQKNRQGGYSRAIEIYDLNIQSDFDQFSDNSILFLKHYATSESDEFILSPYRHIITYKWNKLYLFFWGEAFLYWLHVIFYYLFLLNPFSISLFIVDIICISLLLFYELLTLLSDYQNYATDYWNYVDIFVLSTCFVFLFGNQILDQSTLYNIEWNIFMTASMCMVAIRGFSFFKVFKQSAHFIQMSIKMIKYSLIVLLFIGYFIVCFATILSKTQSDSVYLKDIFDYFNLLFGSLPDGMQDQSVTYQIMIVLGGLIVPIFFINLLIAKLSSSFNNLETRQKVLEFIEQAESIHEFELVGRKIRQIFNIVPKTIEIVRNLPGSAAELPNKDMDQKSTPKEVPSIYLAIDKDLVFEDEEQSSSEKILNKILKNQDSSYSMIKDYLSKMSKEGNECANLKTEKASSLNKTLNSHKELPAIENNLANDTMKKDMDTLLKQNKTVLNMSSITQNHVHELSTQMMKLNTQQKNDLAQTHREMQEYVKKSLQSNLKEIIQSFEKQMSEINKVEKPTDN